MLTFVLQSKDAFSAQLFHLYFVAIALLLISWLSKVVVSKVYRPVRFSGNRLKSVVIIPVFKENPDVIKEVLVRVLDQHPTQLIVAVNGARDQELEGLCGSLSGQNGSNSLIDFVWTPKVGKRYGIAKALEIVRQDIDIVVLVDSDTYWEPDCLVNLLVPFEDLRVGGVTGNQRIRTKGRSIILKWADWFELLRAEYSLPAMSALGSVGCLPGRTIALRRSIIENNLHKFLSERFLGVHLEISDDRTLTNYALLDGYKTVFQSNSKVFTEAPAKFSDFVKQQLRWAKGSQYNTLKMFWWMLRKRPYLWFLYLVDLVTPLMLVATVIGWTSVIFLPGSTNSGDFYYSIQLILGEGLLGVSILAVCALFASWATMGVRTSRLIDYSAQYFWYLPLFMLLNFVVLVPIRAFGLLTCALGNNWGTRGNAALESGGPKSLLRITPLILGLTALVGLVYWGIAI
jgi:hyaluronan synthase